MARFWLSLCLLALCAGCNTNGGIPNGTAFTPSPSPGTTKLTRRAPAAQSAAASAVMTFRTIYTFPGSITQDVPSTPLVVGSTLYGTAGNEAYAIHIPTRAERTLHTFSGGASDGCSPAGSLIDVAGVLYGVTSGCGKYARGTLYSITVGGAERVLYSFRGGSSDGSSPVGSLVYAAGKLYGATSGGGVAGRGTIFAFSISKGERLLHSFKGGSKDGDIPSGGLTLAKDALYGTTYGGGYSCPQEPHRTCGTIFRLTLDGAERMLFAFRQYEGAEPNGNLAYVDGRLYGTTQTGAVNSGQCGSGCGTVFVATLDGSISLLAKLTWPGTFSSGGFPAGGLVYNDGYLYGATFGGGMQGQGLIFRITTNGELQYFPVNSGFFKSGVTYAGGWFYGATAGDGQPRTATVFEFKP